MNCLSCLGNSIPDEVTGYASCKECGLREAPDPKEPWVCVCAPGSFNTSRAPSCHGEDFQPTQIKRLWPTVKCEPCDTLVCVGTIENGGQECPGGAVLPVDPGFILMVDTDADGKPIDTIFQCDDENACPGGSFDPKSAKNTANATACGHGHTGLACAVCESNFQMSHGVCTSCEDTGWWQIFQLVILIVIIIILATQVGHGWWGQFHVGHSTS